MKGLHWLDYALFITTLALSLGIGLYNALIGKPREGGAQSILRDRHRLSFGPVTLSIVMSFMSSIALIATPIEAYFYGMQAIVTHLAKCLGKLVSASVFVPMLYKLEITSVFEYYDLRFGSKALRRLASAQKTIALLVWGGACIYAPSVAMQAVTKMPLWVGIVTMAIVSTVYTAVGGFQAVIWTDTFQAFIYVFGIVFVMIYGLIKAGGITEIFRVSQNGDRLSVFNMSFDPTIRTTFWGAFLPFFVTYCTNVLSDQIILQRTQSCKSVHHAKISVWISAILSLLLETLLMICGLAIYVYYYKIGCDPYHAKQIDSKDQLVPYFVADVLAWPGTVGLFIALLISGSLSSISSIINSCSALTWSDFLSPCFANITAKREIQMVKMLTVLYGAVITVFAFIVASFEANLFQVVYVGILSTTAPLDGLLFLGALFSFVQWKGAVIGLSCSILISSLITIGQYINPISYPVLHTDISSCDVNNASYWIDPHYNSTTFDLNDDNKSVFFLFRISFMWVAAIGWATTVCIGLITSIFTNLKRTSETSVDSKLLIPWNRYFSLFSSNMQNISMNENNAELERMHKISNTTDKIISNDELKPMF